MPPSGIDLTEWQTFRIYWRPAARRVDWTWMRSNGDEVWLRSEDAVFWVPDEPMSLYFNIWAPTEAWREAYDEYLVPAQHPSGDEVYRYEIDYVEVSTGELEPPGDSDGDADVDIRDYENLVEQFGATGEPDSMTADFNGDGIVDIEDFALLRANYGLLAFGDIPYEPQAPAPEPTTMGLLIIGLPLVLKRRGYSQKGMELAESNATDHQPPSLR